MLKPERDEVWTVLRVKNLSIGPDKYKVVVVVQDALKDIDVFLLDMSQMFAYLPNPYKGNLGVLFYIDDKGKRRSHLVKHRH